MTANAQEAAIPIGGAGAVPYAGGGAFGGGEAVTAQTNLSFSITLNFAFPIVGCAIIFYILLFLVEGAIIGLFVFVSYPYMYDYIDTDYYYFGLDTVYPNLAMDYFLYYKMMCDVAIMMLVGYGFLSQFPRYHRWSSLGFTFFAAVLSMQIYILWWGLWDKSFSGNWYVSAVPEQSYPHLYIVIWLASFVAAMKAAVTVLITLGALIGKIDALQILLIILGEVVLYAFNEAIIFRLVLTRDVGGSMYIHSFGACFGIFASWVYAHKAGCSENPNRKQSYGSATLTFVGTLFLWIFFPSFNLHAFVETGNDYIDNVNIHYLTYSPYFELTNLKYLAAMNTFWALTSSTVTTFLVSFIIGRGKFVLEPILMCSITGGIIIGSSADMYAFPIAPLIAGAFIGIVSTLCYHYLPRVLEHLFECACCNVCCACGCCECPGIHDTRGIFSVHLIPGFFGGIAAAIAYCGLGSVWFNYYPMTYYVARNPNAIWNTLMYGGLEIAGLLISMGMGICGGLIIGVVLRIYKRYNFPVDTFGDHVFFKMVNEEPPKVEVPNPIGDQQNNQPQDQPIAPVAQ